MNDRTKILESSGRLVFTVDDLGRFLELSPEVTRLFCTRMVKRGNLVRIKRSLYTLPSYRYRFEERDYFRLANLIQTPSYLSLLTALSYYNISSQIQVGRYESISPVRTTKYTLDTTEFNYFQATKKYYFGFVETEGLFIAEPEKALIDATHLASFGRYAIDLNAISFDKICNQKVDDYARSYPVRTRNLIDDWRKKYGRT